MSASLDQTIRVWDIGSLRRKHSSPSSSPHEGLSPRSGIDLFGAPEGQVKYVLEGHDRGVNWVQFHPSKPLIVSGSDDRSIKLWRFNDSRAWETDTFRGHFNNISCVMFHPHADLIISNSEDKSIRIWDYTKRGAQPIVYRREAERFWILAAHPTLNLLAAGHDAGMSVFKLEYERPAYTVFDESMFLLRNNNLISVDLTAAEQLREMTIAAVQSKVTLPAVVSYSASDNCVLLSSASSGYLLTSVRGNVGADSFKTGDGQFAVFVARNRFVVLQPGGESESAKVLIKALDNTTLKTVECPKDVKRLLPAASGSFFMVSNDKVQQFDLQQDTISIQAPLASVKYAVWSQDMTKLAFFGKNVIYCVDRRTLTTTAVVRDTVNIKSACWDARGILFYTNSHHLKYILPNGDVGIIRTLEGPLYLLRVKDSNCILAVDRACTVRALKVDCTEVYFKMALLSGDSAKVMEMVETGNLTGQSIIAYLRQNGYSEIALGFVTDPATRFELALECCDLQAAGEAAASLDNMEVWTRLADAAMALGNFLVAEECLVKVQDRNRLSFLHLITGNMPKLQAVTEEARATDDLCTLLTNSLLLGDRIEFANGLVDAGLPVLAYLACQTAGLEVEAHDLLQHAPDATVAASVSSTAHSSSRVNHTEPLFSQSSAWPLTANPVKAKLEMKKATSKTLNPTLMPFTDVAHEETVKQAAFEIPSDLESGGWGIEDADLGIDSLPSPTELLEQALDVEDDVLPKRGAQSSSHFRVKVCRQSIPLGCCWSCRRRYASIAQAPRYCKL